MPARAKVPGSSEVPFEGATDPILRPSDVFGDRRLHSRRPRTFAQFRLVRVKLSHHGADEAADVVRRFLEREILLVHEESNGVAGLQAFPELHRVGVDILYTGWLVM